MALLSFVLALALASFASGSRVCCQAPDLPAKMMNKCRHQFKPAPGKCPLLIITAGSTGSGKSGLYKSVLKEFKKDEKNVHLALVDDLVENGQSYKDAVQNFLKTLDVWSDTAKTQPDEAKIEGIFNAPSKEVVDQFNKMYFAFRDGKHQEWDGRTGNQQNDHLLKSAIKNEKNVILETTGSYWPAWIFSFADLRSYQVVWAATAVQVAELMKRNTGRTAKAMTAFLNDPANNPAPRLPHIDSETLGKANALSIKTAGVAISCMTAPKKVALGSKKSKKQFKQSYKKTCGGPPDMVYMQDNNGASAKVIAKITPESKDSAKLAAKAAFSNAVTAPSGSAFLSAQSSLQPLPRV